MNPTEYIRSLLTELVRTPSASGMEMDAILNLVQGALEDLGLRSVVHEDVAAVTASSGHGGVLFNGHLDTVPEGSGWTKDPGMWQGDVLYGRGAADMKAGCVAALAAARDLRDRGIPFSLLFTTDEETSMEGAKKLAASRLVREAASVVVAEPTGLQVVTSEKGVLWYRATVRGRGAHGSLPHLGDNAVYRMGKVLPHLEPLGRTREALEEITVNLGTIRGGTAANVVADVCTVELDCRNPPGTSKEDVEALLRSAFQAAGVAADVELYHEVPAAAIPQDAPHVRLMQGLANASVLRVPYGTEMAYYAAHNPRCLVFGPGAMDRIHGPDERVSLAEVVKASEIFVEYAARLSPHGREGGP